jgi:hypothetical protein
VLCGHPGTLAKHIRNKALFRAFGRVLKVMDTKTQTVAVEMTFDKATKNKYVFAAPTGRRNDRGARMTADEQPVMGWWNALTEEQRAHWLREANTASVAEAWAYYQRVLSQLPD